MDREYHKLPRLFVTPDLLENSSILLNDDQWHYTRNVLRLDGGNKIMAFNTRHGEWLCEIVVQSKKKYFLNPLKQTKIQTPASDLLYAFAPLKKGRLEYMIQKATELGVGLLQPVVTARTVNHKFKTTKIEEYAIEAAEQCTMLNVPQILHTSRFEEFLNLLPAEYHIIFCDEAASIGSPINQIARLKQIKICVLIGPEGGFSEDERQMLLSKNNVSSISLGPRIMRADTAAVAALTLVQATIGDW